MDSEGEDDFLEDADHLEESKEAARSDSEEKEESPQAVAGELGMRKDQNQDPEETGEPIDAAGKDATID